MKTEHTEIIFLLDRSGSMGGLESDTIGGFNAFIEKQKQLEGETIVTTVLFDDQYEVLWNGITARDVRLTERDYYVRGTTALLDVVGKTVLDVDHRLRNTNEQAQPSKVIFVITTDGLENASHEFTYEKIKQLISQKKKKDKWEFIFLGANIDEADEADKMGISVDSAFAFEATSEGVDVMYDKVCSEVVKKRLDE